MMLNTVTVVCTLAASIVALATNEILPPIVPAVENNKAPAIGGQQPAEVGYAPQILVASEQYAAYKSKEESLEQGGLARVGSNPLEANSEELLLSDLFDSMDKDSSSSDEFSSGAGRQFLLFGHHNIAAAGTAVAATIGVAFSYL
ncbi:hypothetical protein GGI23_007249 [Coemansia sp. RSA 2559]|nr:hypothetical protein GGI23_007249 [Coemansia sp. RSA 2559]KAJ2844904.1 hypothetical protein GGI22_006728 [Coemansia erecta]